MIGVKTIGNATLIAFDGEPVLATDPWFHEDHAYFGSWVLPYQIPPEEVDDILRCKFVWLSHGHPDHLNPASIERFKDKTILLPDHVGGRISNELTKNGYQVQVLADRQWVELSGHVRICCVTDSYQDAILLVDVNGRLFLDINDARDRGWGGFVRSVSRRYKETYLLKLAGYGDVDMINLFDENGGRIFTEAAKRHPVGQVLTLYARLYGANHVIPFSFFHRYQRADSVWANQYAAPLEACGEQFDPHVATLLPAFVEIDCETGRIRRINPPETECRIVPPEEFGDNWGDLLEAGDVAKVEHYFQKKEALKDHIGFVRLRVGGKDNTITLNRRVNTGITFEVPRNSLMAAVEFEVFDDLLIGNFMKTTLHNLKSLYPVFSPIVAKYADNGRAQSKRELRRYMGEYLRRAPAAFVLSQLEEESERRFRRFVSRDSLMFNVAARSYVLFKRLARI